MLTDNRWLSSATALQSAEPLWKRVPLRDENGALLGDFMMIIPRLNRKPRVRLEETIGRIEAVLSHYRAVVVYADLNLKLNVLWISMKPRPGMSLELAAAIKAHVPEALLVAQRVDAEAEKRRGWFGRG